MKKKSLGQIKRSGFPRWTLIVLCGIFLLTTAACIYINTPGPEAAQTANTEPQKQETPPVTEPPATKNTETEKPVETPEEIVVPEVTPAPTAAPATEEPTPVPTEEPTPEPTEEPTPVPTEEPTPEPTEEPTPVPTPVPDSFTFGGKKVKTGVKTIKGKDLGINGKKNKLTHITEKEVQDLITLCPDLEVLDLDYCYMDDYEPLGALTKLQYLQLTSCGAGKGNAIEDLDWLEGLTELETLNLAHNNISDTLGLEGLEKLEWLNLGDNPLTDKDLESIGELSNLKTLYLYNLNKITDVEPLSDCTKLTFLHLGGNSKLKSVKPLTSLKKLAYLRLNGTKVGDLSYFGKFTALKKLDLSRCPIKTETVKSLQSCTKLETIVLEMGDTDLYYEVLDKLIGEGYPVHFAYSWSD